MGHAYANFHKAYIVSYRKMPKKKTFHRLIPWQNPVKVKKIPPKNQTLSIPYLLQVQSSLVLLQLLACYCGSTTMCRQDGNCVNPNHTDSKGAG